MQFRVLGPVQAESAGVAVPLSRRRDRCLLGVLLLHLDQVITVDELAELLWDREPPDPARRVVHTHISRLRAALARPGRPESGGGPGFTLATVGDGYRMTTDPQAVDAHRFRSMVEQAARTADPATRAARLQAALDLWRGPALADAASTWLRDRLCADLQEQRLGGIEDLMDTRLALRQERQILPELARLAGSHPTREQLTALHMRALYQAGRTAEALAQYERTRTHLADELGLDPGPPLRQVHQAILRNQLPIPEPAAAPATATSASPPPEPDHVFARAVAACRHRLSMTQEELAGKTGLSVRSIGKLEAGRIKHPRPATVRLLADAFGLTGPDRDAFHRAATSPAGDDPLAQYPVPAQLPADVHAFTGREAELAELDSLLAAARDRPTSVVISAIAGAAGIGKTTLAVHWAHRVRQHFPDGQLYIDLRGFTQSAVPEDPSNLLERLLRAMGTPGPQIPVDVDDRAGLWRSVLAGRRILIVLDNAADATQVRPLLPGVAGCLVLVTSRRDLASLEPTYGVSLDMLPSADAVALFTHTAGPDRTESEPEQVAEVVELCGRLPLAIRIAAGRLRSHSSWRPSDLAERLRDQDRRLAELADRDGSRSVTTALELSYRQLRPDQQRMYRLLGLHPGHHIEPYAAAALADTTLEPARRRLDQLLDVSLLPEPAPGRYAFHDLVRSHARRTAIRDEPEPSRAAALRRLLDYYRHATSVATGIAYPYVRRHLLQVPAVSGPVPEFPGPEAAGGWLDTELPNLMAVVHHAADHGWPEYALQTAGILQQHLLIRGAFQDSRILSHRSLALARATGDRYAEMRAIACRAWIHMQQGEYPQAIDDYQQVRQLAVASGDQLAEMYAGVGIGDVLQRQGRYGEALIDVERALELAVAGGHERTQAVWIRNVLAHLHLLHGRLATARDHHRWSLEIAERIGDHAGGMFAQLGFGHIDKRLGRFEAAYAHYRRALAGARSTGNRGNLINPLLGIGDLNRLQGHHRRAAGKYRRALRIAQGTNHRIGQMEALHCLGRLHHATGEPEIALTYHQQALELAADLQHFADQARIHDGLAHAHLALRQPERARQHWQRALDILADLGTEHTPDEDATAPAIRTHLAGLVPEP